MVVVEAAADLVEIEAGTVVLDETLVDQVQDRVGTTEAVEETEEVVAAAVVVVVALVDKLVLLIYPHSASIKLDEKDSNSFPFVYWREPGDTRNRSHR